MKTSMFIRRALGMVLFSLLAAAGLWWWLQPPPVAVTVKVAQRGAVEATVVNTRAGTVEACQRTRLSPILGGRIAYLGVKEGDRVKKGQLLMRLWNEDQKAQQHLAETQRNAAAARVGEVCISAANAAREAERQTALRARGYVSVAREDAARSDAEARAAACRTARADVASAEARIGATRTEQTRTVLYAPFDGTVAKIVGELGEYSTPSPPGVQTPPAIDLIDESCLYVKAPMDEVDAPKFRLGQPVRVRLDALPKQVFPGRVRRIAPYVLAVEKQSRTVDVEVDFTPLPNERLLVGYSADVEVVLDRHDNVLRVPTPALGEGNRVLIVDGDGRLAERKVKTGLANWEWTEVVEGLAGGERVVTSLDKEGVKVGARVTASEASNEPPTK
ncbi:MAG: efflux RND transporter periplasmic adaptor subunit [Betaproteobacteria bacterium HGW-Betaproteobacteria-11]|nr:MAG: efflux RND transporter periplasmic adaptor subunit [Betaproteobacteria bacterium HGW-Betaproteobacteria-11]